MAEFFGDINAIFTAAAGADFDFVNGKFSRAGEIVAFALSSDSGRPNHLELSTHIGRKPTKADDHGKLMISCDPMAQPPSLFVESSMKSYDFPGVGSQAERAISDSLLKTFFEAAFQTFTGQQLINFTYVSRPFPQ